MGSPDGYISSMESVAFGQVRASGMYDIVASTYGGSVVLIDPQPGGFSPPDIVTESRDFGCAAVGLACADLTNDGIDEVLVGTFVAPDRTTTGAPSSTPFHDMKGFLHVLQFDGQTSKFVELARRPIGVGVFGIAVGEVDGTTTEPEVVVGTLEGDLIVFNTTSSGTLVEPPLCTRAFPGAVGGFNSIHIADLLTYGGNPPEYTYTPGSPDGKAEVYFASSSGLRRLVVQ
ncbi:MAG: hypothetical protein H6834_18480 [Planctomycetes bacterium]|nr:hypothetical protein [Planctomycetota bacterium]